MLIKYLSTSVILFGQFLSLGCKTLPKPANNELAGTDESTFAICYGDRKILGGDTNSMNFQAEYVSPPNSYWLTYLAGLAYFSDSDLKKHVESMFGSNLVDYHFYDSTQLEGRGAESFYVRSDKGWVLSFRGTMGAKDWLTNFERTKFKTNGVNANGDFEEMQLHRGFYKSATVVFDKFVAAYLSQAKDITLGVGTPEAYRLIDLAMRGAANNADVFSTYKPDAEFTEALNRLKNYGLIDKDAPMVELLQVVSIWAEEITNAGIVQQAAKKGGANDSRLPVILQNLKKSPARKQAAAIRVHPYFKFKAFEPIWLTGHSYGGALATIAGFQLMKHGIPVQGIVSMGSPRVGNDIFKNVFESMLARDGKTLSYARFHRYQDMIPLVPKLGGPWAHVFDPWFLTSKKGLYIPNFQNGLTENLKTSFNEIWKSQPGRETARYSDVTTLPDWTGILNTDVLLANHSMTKHYIPLMEKLSYGENLDCDKVDQKSVIRAP